MHFSMSYIDFDVVFAHIGQDGIALRIERDDLLDLLTQRSALLRQVLACFSETSLLPRQPSTPHWDVDK